MDNINKQQYKCELERILRCYVPIELITNGKQCPQYCGVACVDGTCPIANRDEYAERGYDTIDDCEKCLYYNGCDDCIFERDNIVTSSWHSHFLNKFLEVQ